MLFAFLWGIVFKSYIIRATAPTWILTASSVFTAAVGRWLPWELSRFYGTIAENSNIVISLFGNLFGIGICEEICKILPVVAYLLWKRRNADPKVCILIGVFSGLGFAAFENRIYAERTIANESVQEAVKEVLARSLSCVFSHALYSGIFAYFLTVAFLTGRRT